VSAGCPHDLCDGSGFLYDEETNTARPCRCRPQRIARARARSLSAVIPKRFRDAAWDRQPVVDLDPTTVRLTRRFAEQIDAHLEEGDGLFIMGDIGTGKTTLAMLVSKAALERGHTVAIYSVPRLLAYLRTTFYEDSTEGHAELLDRLAGVDLLHLDDLGSEKTSPWVLEELYSIINSRYEEKRSVIVTTNVTEPSELREQIGARTMSRLQTMCLYLPVFGHDRRADFSAA
jgi:DNA replication protein DnaC